MDNQRQVEDLPPEGIRVVLRWNESTEQWRMIDADNSRFIQEFYDCENFHKVFLDCHKGENRNNLYYLTARKIK